MSRYEYGDVSFEPPTQWNEHRVIAFSAPHAEGEPSSNVTLAREPRRSGDTIRAHVNRQLVSMAASVPGFEMKEMLDVQVGGRPAVRVRAAWPSAAGVVEQLSVHVAPDTHEASVLTITCTSVARGRDEARVVFDRMMASASFAPRAAMPAPAPKLTPLPATPERTTPLPASPRPLSPPPMWDPVAHWKSPDSRAR